MGVVARWVVPFLTVVGVTVAGASTQTGVAPPIRLVDSGNPIAGHNLYVDPTSAAMAAAHHANPPSAELDAIANTPQAFWIDGAVPSAAIGRYVNGATAAGAMPVLAVYALPHRDCGSYAAGGFGSGDAYRQWIDGVASTVGGSPATFIVEPDALDMADCLSGGQRDERYSLIRYAVDTFTRSPAAAVYIDGGHSRWLPAAEIANRLNQVGINHARGFSLNTSNFFSTDEETGYGEDVSGRTGGSHYVIDTSRNGAGPAPDAAHNWCNPSGRALGVPPTTATAGGHADAYLWVKRPGDSDGSCGRGEPGPGHFMNDYAIDLARAAHH
jgi:endoglucanase